MRNIIRRISRAGRDSDVWPVVLLVLAVLVPAVCLLWFMRAAMRNERLAARQTLAEVYRGQLASSQAQLDGYWQTTASKLEERARKGSAATAFAECVQFGAVDSVIVFDARGNVAYPNVPTKVDSQTSQFEAKWAEASQLEFARKDYLPAAAVYHAIAIGATNVNLAARALQAEARCLVQADRKDAAIRLVTDELARERYDQAADPQGRLIAANAELMVLELLSDQASPAFQASARKLHQRLADYANPVLASPQRCFLMKELQSLWPEVEFPTLAAEELAVKLRDSLPVDTAFHRTSRPEVWQFATADRRVLAFVRSDKILASVRAASTSADARLSLIAPGGDPDAAFVSVPAGPRFPGWRLALSLEGNQLFDAAADHRKTFYLWTALFVLAAMGVLTLLTVRVLRRHATLARLKNDLAATVSHELKTPLSSTRVLVDTLLDTKSLDERKTREYLRLIAQENERLSRVVQNFLSFSRMEQRKYAFRFSPLSPRQIAEAAIAVMRERLEAPGCRFELHIDDALPGISADVDALEISLINLLDNACKYSGDIKHIVLNVSCDAGMVVFAVRDNGVGIDSRDLKRVFRPFFQADERLSRTGGGCGLGLNIVQSIVTAHHGNISVVSEPGRGSTFRIAIPVALNAESARTEAMA